MPPFGRELHIRFIICSLCILTYCNSSISHFGSDASVPGHSLYFTFYFIKVGCAGF